MAATALTPVLIRIDARAENYLHAGIAALDAGDPLAVFAEALLARVDGQPASDARGFIADESADGEPSAHAGDARTRLPRRHPMRSALNALVPQYL